MGNTGITGINYIEIQLMIESEMNGNQIINSATVVPANFWNISRDYGTIEVGKYASLLVYDRNPLTDPTVIANPSMVFIFGKLQKCENCVCNDNSTVVTTNKIISSSSGDNTSTSSSFVLNYLFTLYILFLVL